MKYFLCLALFSLPLLSLANDEAAILNALGVHGTKAVSLPTVIPTNSASPNSIPARSVASESAPAIDPAKAKEIMEQLSKHQKDMEEQAKFLEELDAEE